MVEADLRDAAAVEALFASNQFYGVIHFAGLKAVGESKAFPLRYYDNNVVGTLNLLKAMQRHRVATLVFSSSATVYGAVAEQPIPETAPCVAVNPYGRSKLMVEEILADACQAEASMQVAVLRYFNPVGAHPSGLIGEAPVGIPNNLMPYIAQVATGIREYLAVFGNNYPTRDGTGIRDYIHVMDLARGHLAALDTMLAKPGGALLKVNLGTGRGTSVLELLAAFEAASGRSIPYQITGRRPGDVAECYADVGLARELLGWEARLGLTAMCEDAWRWQVGNPQGYHVA